MKNLIVVIFLSLSFCLIGQPINKQIKDIDRPSPNAGMMNKFIDIPTLGASGIPSINIPIASLDYGNLSVPVSLSYHAGGVKLAEHASWVGLNWSLNAGGMISRQVQGIPDENFQGYYTNGANIPNDIINSFPNYCQIYNNAEGGGYDMESDMFSVSYPEGNYQFYINENQTIIKLNDDNNDKLRIITIGTDIFAGIEITTDKGNIYTFGRSLATDPLNYENTQIGSTGFTNRTGWHLTNVKSFDLIYTINFVYADETITYTTKASNSHTSNSIGNGGGTNAPISRIYSSTSRRLTEINSPESKIEFIANTARQDVTGNRLDEINIYPIGNQTNFCKKFTFHYSHFLDNRFTPTLSHHRKLKLDKIEEKSCDLSVLIPATTFDYIGTKIGQDIFLPNILSNEVDHWGYNNGKTSNNSLTVNVPNESVTLPTGSISYGSANREIDANFTQIGTLNKIVWPTGGQSEFIYENNVVTANTGAPTNTNVVNIATCGTPSQACCGSLTNQVNFTFTANQLASAKFRLEATRIFGSTCQNNPVTVTASVWQGATQVGYYQFNLASGQSSGNVNDLPLSVFGSLTAGINYTFRVQSQDGRGALIVYTQSFVTTEKLAPGLRLKTLIVNEGNLNTKITKEFSYLGSNGKSSGNIRTIEPKYAIGFSNVEFGPLTNDQGTSVTWSDSPVNTNPAYGNTVIYSKIREYIVGNGYTNFTYDTLLLLAPYASSSPIFGTTVFCTNNANLPTATAMTCLTGNCVETPLFQFNKRGKLLIQEIFNEGNTLIEKEEFTYNYITQNSTGTNIKLKVLNYAAPSTFRILYVLNSSRSLLLSKKHFKDGVETITNYTYDNLNRHTFPKTVSVTNSDNKTVVETNFYSHEYPNTTIQQSLLSKNLIKQYKNEKLVATIKVDGSEEEYALFNNSQPRLHKIYRDKYTWSSTGVISGTNKVLEATINAYDTRGNISQMTQEGWAPEYFTWNNNGSLLSKTFNNFVKQYNYYSNTRLLQSFIDVDGQTTNYEFDKLSRLKRVSERGGNVLTDVSYNFKTPTDPFNWMKVKKTFTPVSNSALNILEDISYFDGFGRHTSTIKKNQAANGFDLIVDAKKFDNKGRADKIFEPYQSPNSNGSYFDIPTSAPHTMIAFEPSPLNRAASSTPATWHATLISYGSNNSTDAVKYASNLSTNYPDNTLSKEIATDPNGNRTITFKDKLGRTILVRKTNSSGIEIADTYTNFDDKGRIRNVYPPSTTTSSTNLIFSYLYDGEDKMTWKKVPDMDGVTINYNSRDLPAATWLPKENKWLVNNYDIFGRATITGLTSNSTLPSNLESITIPDILSQAVYDGASGLGVTRTPTNIDKGKLTTEQVRILGTSNFVSTTNFYDTYGRIDFKRANNHLNLGSINVLSPPERWLYSYDFADNIITETRNHNINGHTRTITTTNVYNNKGLLQDVNFNGGVGESNRLISTMTYTHRNQLLSKSIGVTNTLQKLDYTYNPQGWLSSINPALPIPSSFVQFPTTLPSGTGNLNNDLFHMAIQYDNPETNVGSTTTIQRNGNIAQLQHQTIGREKEYWSYSYDYLDRLRTASHTRMNGVGGIAVGHFTENITYDGPRGNISSIIRNGLLVNQSGGNYTSSSSGLIDNLTLTYIAGTNRLSSVVDNGNVSFRHLGFNILSGGGASTNSYDASGNLTYDHTKKATIAYNYLNLPSTITFANGNIIDYTYDASGKKLTTTRRLNTTTTSEIQHYLDGIEYKQQIATTNYRLEAIYHPEGRIYNTDITNLASSTITLRHEFCIKDHLGNTRLTFTDKNNDGSIQVPGEILQENHYYPFGMNTNGPWMNDAAANDKPYQYNGKELESFGGLGWNDYGARFYDPSIGRFTTVDPMAEAAPGWSPFRYGFNNPLAYTDPTGMAEEPVNENQRKTQNAEENYANLRSFGDFTKAAASGEIDEHSQMSTNSSGDKSASSETQSDDCNCDCPGKPPCESEGASVGESLVPFMGSYLDYKYRMERGDYFRAGGNGFLFITDVFLIKSLFFGLGKGVVKAGLKQGTKRYFGIGMSHEYSATVSRLSRLGVDMSGYKHHWLISQSMMNKHVWLKPIGNQAWNLTRFSSQASHIRWGHGYKFGDQSAIWGWKFLYPISSTPLGFKLGIASSTGHIYSTSQK